MTRCTQPFHESGPLYGCDRAELDAMRGRTERAASHRGSLECLRRRVLKWLGNSDTRATINHLSVSLHMRKDFVRSAISSLFGAGQIERAGSIEEKMPQGGLRNAAAYQITEAEREVLRGYEETGG